MLPSLPIVIVATVVMMSADAFGQHLARSAEAATTPAVVTDEAANAALQRFRSASAAGEARRAFDDLRARAPASPQAALACGVLASRLGSVVYDRAIAMSCFSEGAKLGMPEAQHQLAVMLLETGDAAQRAEALALLSRAAPSSPESVYMLAKLRAERSPDPTQALADVEQKAASAGFAPAQLDWARRLMQRGAAEQAATWLERAAASGHPEAAYELAMVLEERTPGAETVRVVALLDQASRGGSIRADYALALRYLEARGVKRDTERAFTLMQRAAMAGHREAQYGAGYMVGQGLGTPSDDARALEWLRQAAERGHVEAAFGVGNYYANGWGIGKSMDLAYKWYCRAAQAGHDQAATMVRRAGRGGDCTLPKSNGPE